MSKASKAIDEILSREGQEPLEEVPIGECDASIQEVEHRGGERDGAIHDSQVTFGDELSESYVPKPIPVGISPADGLPVPLDDITQLALAPAYSLDTVLCAEDSRSFVEVFAEDLRPEERDAMARMNGPFDAKKSSIERSRALLGALAGGCFAFAVVERSVLGAVLATVALLCLAWLVREKPKGELRFGARSRFAGKGAERNAASFAPAAVKVRFGQRFVRVERPNGEAKPGLEALDAVLVRPVREACKYYKRQMVANDDQPDPNSPGHKLIFRNCTQRRSVGGAFMSLRDEAVYGCDYRHPPSPASFELLNRTDADVLAKASTREMVPLFNITKKKKD